MGNVTAGSHRNPHSNKTPCVHKLENIIDTDKFLEKYNLLKLTQEEKKPAYGLISIKEMEFLMETSRKGNSRAGPGLH